MTAVISDELRKLTRAIDVWAQNYRVIKKVFIFGSRVRGDHRVDSDVDMRIEPDPTQPPDEVMKWTQLHETDFADLKSMLPGELRLHQYDDDAALPAIEEGAKKPVLVIGKVHCVYTPPKQQP